MSKQRALDRHFDFRVMQRFGVRLSESTKKRLVHEIQTGQLRFIHRRSNSRSLWYATINEVEAILVYDKPRHVLVTAWPAREGEFFDLQEPVDPFDLRD